MLRLVEEVNGILFVIIEEVKVKILVGILVDDFLKSV